MFSLHNGNNIITDNEIQFDNYFYYKYYYIVICYGKNVHRNLSRVLCTIFTAIDVICSLKNFQKLGKFNTRKLVEKFKRICNL